MYYKFTVHKLVQNYILKLKFATTRYRHPAKLRLSRYMVNGRLAAVHSEQLILSVLNASIQINISSTEQLHPRTHI